MSPTQHSRELAHSPALTRALATSRALTFRGLPHALIGGLAVRLYGHLRPTHGVDFLVDPRAFQRTDTQVVIHSALVELVADGVVNLIGMSPDISGLSDELQIGEGLAVISLHGLMHLKLTAGRAQDRVDVRRLLEIHPGALRTLRDHLSAHAPDLVPTLGEVISA